MSTITKPMLLQARTIGNHFFEPHFLGIRKKNFSSHPDFLADTNLRFQKCQSIESVKRHTQSMIEGAIITVGSLNRVMIKADMVALVEIVIPCETY